MSLPRIGQKQVTQLIETLRWELHGDDAEAAMETRRRARLTGPDSIAFLHYVLRTDNFASSTQRVRAATVLLDVGEFLAYESKETGLSSKNADNSGDQPEAS